MLHQTQRSPVIPNRDLLYQPHHISLQKVVTKCTLITSAEDTPAQAFPREPWQHRSRAVKLRTAFPAGIPFISNQTLGPTNSCPLIPLQAFLGLSPHSFFFFFFKSCPYKINFPKKEKKGVSWDLSTKLIYFSKLLN